MNLKEALDSARTAIELAEEAADDNSRKQYLKMAHDYLRQADVDGWARRKFPAVIIALEEDTTIEGYTSKREDARRGPCNRSFDPA
jgi:hypothetical protein